MKNNFQIEFYNTDAGWIDFFVKAGYVTLNYSFSDIGTLPEELINWTEKIYKEEFELFDCDMEDVHCFFEYDGKYLTISDTTNIDGTNPKSEKRSRIKTEVDKEYLCKTIYKAFRKFVTSNLYVRPRWDGCNFKEFLTERFSSIENALEIASEKSLKEFYDEILIEIPTPELGLGFEVFAEYELSDGEKHEKIFNHLSKEEKKEFLIKFYEDYSGNRFNLKNLREVKSEILEKLVM